MCPQTRILKASRINTGRKLGFPEPVTRSLLDPETDPDDVRIVWHYLEVPDQDRPAMPVISDQVVEAPNIQNTWTACETYGGRYIRPPDKVVELVDGSFEHGTQTVAAFIADILRCNEIEIRDAYDPDRMFFASEDEYNAALDKEIPRYVFYASHEYMKDERKVDYYFLMSQESFSYCSRETRELMLLHGNILNDNRIFAVLDELVRTDRFNPDFSLFD